MAMAEADELAVAQCLLETEMVTPINAKLYDLIMRLNVLLHTATKPQSIEKHQLRRRFLLARLSDFEALLTIYEKDLVSTEEG